MFLHLSLLLASSAVPPLAAPAHECDCALDPTLSADQAALCANQQAGAYDPSPGDPWDAKTVSVRFHVVERPGVLSGAVPPCTPSPGLAALARMVDLLNTAYSGAGIRFAPLLEVDVIESGDLHRISCTDELAQLLATNNEPNAIDVYFVDQLFPVPSAAACTALPGICVSINGWASTTTTSLGQGVVLRKCGSELFAPCDCASLQPGCGDCPPDCGRFVEKILVHEMGHYFDLLHPNSDDYGADCPGAGPAGAATCGDFVADTPAEPLPSTYSVAGCSAVGLPAPPCGNAPYQVDLANYMSNEPEGLPCRDHLTRGQLRRARATLVNLRAVELL